ncbi:MAG: cell division protein ZapA [Bacteroidales bacterium]|nr:cell division protein ZapA [Bacteroidales bacterium]
MDEKFSIKINIAERYYPLMIDRKDEERIRKAAKIINDKVTQYKTKYTDKDDQDFLAMTTLQYVTRFLENEEKIDDSEVVEGIKELTRNLSLYLDKEQVL